MPEGLPRKIRHVIQRQVLLASVAMVVGAYGIGLVVAHLLALERLREEADDYLHGRAADRAFPLPHNSRMAAWYVPHVRSGNGTIAQPPPAQVGALPEGSHRLPDGRRVLVREDADGRLYLVMSFQVIDRVAALTSLATALFALAVLCLVSWRTYRISKRMVTPVSQLAATVADWDPAQTDPHALRAFVGESGNEVSKLVAALNGLAERTRDFVRRERNFTRDASHELRTPLTVVRVATDMLRGDPGMPTHAQRSLLRIQRAGQDMEALVEAFLILAREQGIAPISEEFEVREIVEEEVEKARPLIRDKPVELRVLPLASPRLHAPPRVLAVMLGNLLRNALTFTEAGSVEVEVREDRIVVRDTGIGMSHDELEHVYDPFYRADQFHPVGKGIGLNIVHRLGERFGWPVALDSVKGKGTVAVIHLLPSK